jgi:hypothetical protein
VNFLPRYIEAGIFRDDPFQVLDQEGVGQLIEMAVRAGRAARPDIKVGICGEHGGEPSSVEFFHRTGLDYVSCSPYRVPVARLAAAQSALRDQRAGEVRESDTGPAARKTPPVEQLVQAPDAGLAPPVYRRTAAAPIK